VERVPGGTLLLETSLDCAERKQRPAELEGVVEALVLLHRPREGRHRPPLVAPRCADEPSAPGRGRERQRAVRRGPLPFQARDDRLGPLELAKGDERLDLVGQTGERTWLADPHGGDEVWYGSEVSVGAADVTERQLEEAERCSIVDLPEPVPVTFAELEPLDAVATSAVDVSAQRPDQGPRSENGPQDLELARFGGDLVRPRRRRRMLRPSRRHGTRGA